MDMCTVPAAFCETIVTSLPAQKLSSQQGSMSPMVTNLPVPQDNVVNIPVCTSVP
jgi:hypothetical protein